MFFPFCPLGGRCCVVVVVAGRRFFLAERPGTLSRVVRTKKNKTLVLRPVVARAACATRDNCCLLARDALARAIHAARLALRERAKRRASLRLCRLSS